jgi:hypothetical protein
VFKGMLRYTPLVTSLLLALAFTSCKDKKAVNTIRVEGFVENLLVGKVHLTDAYDWKIVFDSANATNGHFAFDLASDTAFVPFLASVHYPDSTRNKFHYIRQLSYLNSHESSGKIVSYTSAFFLGSEGAIIKGSIDSTLKVYAGKGNELYQQLSGNGFGYISTRDPANRPSRLRYFKSLIKRILLRIFFLKAF